MGTRKHYPRLAEAPRQSFFLFGVRGVGKSTWVREALPGALTIDLLDQQTLLSFQADPGLGARRFGTRPPQSWIVIDEIQRCPSLLDEVHRAIELRALNFALLGSSARRLKAAGVNLLAGRALARHLRPMTPHELGEDFDLESALKIGTIPLIVMAPEPDQSLASYVELYLREEIRVEALVRNLESFVRFIDVAASVHAQPINTTSIAREAGVARKTVEGYLQILEDTLMVSRLRALELKLRVKERKRSKLYWTDPGILRACRRRFGPIQAEERGALFEGLVHNLLLAHRDSRRLYEDLTYWSVQSGVEVDFVLRRGDDLLAIEAKSSHRLHPAMLKGLRAIGELPRTARRILVLPEGTPQRTDDGIDILDIRTLEEEIMSGTLWR